MNSLPAARAVDQDFWPRLAVGFAQPAQRHDRPVKMTTASSSGQIDRFDGHRSIFRHTDVFSISAHALSDVAKDLIALLEAGDR